MGFPKYLFSCTALVCAIFQTVDSSRANGLRPSHIRTPRNGLMPQRRANCEPAGPDVSEDKIIADACNKNPQNNFDVCYNETSAYIQQATIPTCGHFYQLYSDCLVLNDQDEASCSDSKLGYTDCANYTLQAYAICGCYWALPADLAECAKVILEFRPNTPASSYINKGAPSTSGLLTSAISLTDSLTPSSPPGAVTSNSANSGYSSGYSIAVPTISHSIACGPEGCYAHSSSSTASSPSIPSLSFDPSQLTLTGPPQPLGTQTTSIITSVVPTTVTTTMTSPYFEILTYTTQYTTTLYSCDGGCTPPPLPTVAPLIPSPGQASPQVTSTGISTIIVTKTSTITSCAPTLTSCPASLPATSTYTETETRTILSCEGGCTGPAPAGAKDVCVRRLRKRTIVLDGLLS